MGFKLVSSNAFYYCRGGDCEDAVSTRRADNTDFARYHPAHGLNVANIYDYGVAQINGQVLKRDLIPDTFNIVVGTHGYDFLTDKFLLCESAGYPRTGEVYLQDWEVLEWESNPVEVWERGEDPPVPVQNMVRLSDRYIYATSGGYPHKVSVKWCPLDRSSDWAVEYEADEASGSGSMFWISEAAEPGHVWLTDLRGRAYLYDVDNKTLVSHLSHIFRKPGEAREDIKYYYGMTFVKDLGVFIGIYWPGSTDPARIEVWIPEVVPYALEDPYNLDPMQTGSVSRIRARLLGEHDEPVPDYPVNWEITDGNGSLSAEQSMTDADGYAEVSYIPTFTPTTLTVQASAEI